MTKFHFPTKRARRIKTALIEGIRQGLSSLQTAPWRAGLTILGVAIGVFVVVVMAAVINGINISIAEDLKAAGPNSFFVYRRPVGIQACDGTEDTCLWRSNPALTSQEGAALSILPEIQDVILHVSGIVNVFVESKKISGVVLTGYSSNFLSGVGGTLLEGRSFSQLESKTGERVAIINTVLAQSLFPNRAVTGRSLRIGSQSFRIIGLYKEPASFLGRPGQAGGENDPQVIVLLPEAKRLGASLIRMDFTVRPKDGVSSAVAREATLVALRQIRKLKPTDRTTFEIVSQDLLLATYDRLFGTFFLVMITLSGVGLLVGGVGVIAVMTIAVTERTKEIGIRKALGAPRGLILWQFLVEASLLTGCGAVGGLLAGILTTFAISSFSPLPAAIPIWAIGVSLLSALATGVLFGLVPAVRASRLNPVEALRWE